MKKFIIITLLLLGLLFLFKINPFVLNKNEVPKKSETGKKIGVEQKISGDKKTETFQKYETEANKTALDLLRRSASVVTKGEKENAYIVEINGRKADERKNEFWAFYLNGKTAQVGAGSYKLKNGDKIEWKIENY